MRYPIHLFNLFNLFSLFNQFIELVAREMEKSVCYLFGFGSLRSNLISRLLFLKGCRGNQNNFLAQEDCSKSCSLVRAPQGKVK